MKPILRIFEKIIPMKRQAVGMNIVTLVIGLTGWIGVRGQQPNYTFRKFVRDEDTTEFREIKPSGDGFSRSYLSTVLQVYNVDDDSTTYMMNRQQALLCMEGQLRNNKREGLFTFYLIDNADHSKRYKVWEQNFVNNKLNGQWRTFTLRGGLVRFQTYLNDSLNGISRTYWIDGKGIMDEAEYFSGKNKFIQRTYYKDGKPESEMPYENGKPSGTVKRYYETGTLQETQEMKSGRADGVRRYYYPNGRLWFDQVYKAGKNWEVRANYTANGQRRKAGTLHNGNGTVIFYNDDGTVREVKTYVNGEPK
jgi:antitoxin component YwqK of YwqJK toxin-antitoxin module